MIDSISSLCRDFSKLIELCLFYLIILPFMVEFLAGLLFYTELPLGASLTMDYLKELDPARQFRSNFVLRRGGLFSSRTASGAIDVAYFIDPFIWDKF